MSSTFILAAFLACFWGIVLACLLQFTKRGRWLAAKRTYIAVIIGVGVDLLLMLYFLSITQWLQVVVVVTVSGIGLIARSIYNESQEDIS